MDGLQQVKNIDAEKLKKELDAWARIIQSPDKYMREDALYIIDMMPIIDAVPVVRCSNCKFYYPPVVSRDSGICSFKNRNELVCSYDYCSSGKKAHSDNVKPK